jgi:hypothetical protein
MVYLKKKNSEVKQKLLLTYQIKKVSFKIKLLLTKICYIEIKIRSKFEKVQQGTPD